LRQTPFNAAGGDDFDSIREGQGRPDRLLGENLNEFIDTFVGSQDRAGKV